MQSFQVCIRQLEPPPEGTHAVATVFIDGKLTVKFEILTNLVLINPLFWSSPLGKRTNKTVLHRFSDTRISGFRTKRDRRRPFRFSTLPIKGLFPYQASLPTQRSWRWAHGCLDKDNVVWEDDLDRISGLGTIRIVTSIVKLEHKSPSDIELRRFYPRSDITDILPIHDDVKLQTSHCTSFGPEGRFFPFHPHHSGKTDAGYWLIDNSLCEPCRWKSHGGHTCVSDSSVQLSVWSYW